MAASPDLPAKYSIYQWHGSLEDGAELVKYSARSARVRDQFVMTARLSFVILAGLLILLGSYTVRLVEFQSPRVTQPESTEAQRAKTEQRALVSQDQEERSIEASRAAGRFEAKQRETGGLKEPLALQRMADARQQFELGPHVSVKPQEIYFDKPEARERAREVAKVRKQHALERARRTRHVVSRPSAVPRPRGT
jgi:hypothetical protein